MKLIDKNINDIIAGFDNLLRAEIDLRSRWRSKLLTAYARRKAKSKQEIGKQNRSRILILLSVLIAASLIFFGIGQACRGVLQKEENLLWYCCAGPLLALLGVLILGAAGFSRRSAPPPKPRRVPLHPLRSGSQQKGIFPDLRIPWMEGLEGVLKDEVPDYPDYKNTSTKDHGAEGERVFIQRLREICCDDYFVLARAMQHPKEDVDVILIGPKGIWVFEVKHWSGEIYWDDSGWRRKQIYYERGGIEVIKQPEVLQPPDEQWIRGAAEVRRTLQYRAADVLEKYPELEKVRGGIVFTKEEAIFKFQPGRPTFWGPLNFWIKILQEAEPKVVIDRRSTLQLVDALLDRHHEIAPNGDHRSMVTYAQDVVREVDAKLDAWVQG